MKEGSNMVPISVIATDICDNFGDSDRKFFGEHLKNIINHYKTLHIFLMNEISVKSQIMPLSNIMDLPCDFVKETKIGVINANGRIATMTVDRSLRIPPVASSTADVDRALEDILTDSASAVFFPFYNTFGIGGGFIGELYGYACSLNTLGYFNIDRKERTIAVASTLPSDMELIIEYKSDGVSDGLQLVPTEIVNLITYKCKSIFCLDKKDQRHVTYENQFEVEYKQIKKLYYAKKIDHYAQVMAQYNQSAPK
jgi:hypothetical protein